MKNLRHTFVQDDDERPGVCYCGDVDFVHQPQTLRRRIKRLWFRFTFWLQYELFDAGLSHCSRNMTPEDEEICERAW
jgi:hypothetical protein